MPHQVPEKIDKPQEHKAAWGMMYCHGSFNLKLGKPGNMMQ